MHKQAGAYTVILHSAYVLVYQYTRDEHFLTVYFLYTVVVLKSTIATCGFGLLHLVAL